MGDLISLVVWQTTAALLWRRVNILGYLAYGRVPARIEQVMPWVAFASIVLTLFRIVEAVA